MKNILIILDKLIKVNILMLMLFYCILISPLSAFAEDATINSQNYEITGQADFSGGISESENYQVEGIMTDIKDVDSFPQEEVEEIEVQETIDTVEIVPKKPTIIDQIRDFIESPLAKDILRGLTYTGAILGAVSLLASALMNAQWLSIGSQLFSRIWFFLGWTKKRYRWGRVYDAESNLPLEGAIVTIFDSEKKKALATDISNSEGRYGFLVKPGQYYMQAVKKNYSFPSHIVSRDYHSEVFEIKEENEVITDLNIPIDPNIAKLGNRLAILTGILDFLNIIRIPILVLGTILSVMFIVYYHTIYDWVILGLYIVLWTIEIYKLKRVKSFGMVKSVDENIPLPQSIIRVMDKEHNRLMATKVTSGNGKYFYLVNPGNYSLVATKIGYEQYTIDSLTFKKGDVIAKDILMHKIIDNIRRDNEK